MPSEDMPWRRARCRRCGRVLNDEECLATFGRFRHFATPLRPRCCNDGRVFDLTHVTEIVPLGRTEPYRRGR
jgi:hypothetical protein